MRAKLGGLVVFVAIATLWSGVPPAQAQPPNGETSGFGIDAAGVGTSTEGMVDLELTPTGQGAWLAHQLGVVVTLGDAPHHGDRPPLRLGELVSTIAATPDGRGYWLFTDLGRAFAYGTARDHGDMSGVVLNGPVVDAVATPSGLGYYMVGSDGGVFSFGDAQFHGSMGGTVLNEPVNGLVPDPDGVGYWLVAGDGGVFSFEAEFRGSMGGAPLNAPVVGMVADGAGYLMVGADGGAFVFGGEFFGSLGGTPIPRPIRSIAAVEAGTGYVMLDPAGITYPFGSPPAWPAPQLGAVPDPVIGGSVLLLGDMPAGWTSVPLVPSSADDPCPQVVFDGEPGSGSARVAYQDEFGLAVLDLEIGAFPLGSGSRFLQFIREDVERCPVRQGSGFVVELSPASSPAIGDETVALRVRYVEDSGVEVIGSAIYSRVDDVVVITTYVDVFGSFDDGVTWQRRAVERLVAVMRQNGSDI